MTKAHEVDDGEGWDGMDDYEPCIGPPDGSLETSYEDDDWSTPGCGIPGCDCHNDYLQCEPDEDD